MKRKRVQRSGIDPNYGVPSDLVRLGDEIKGGGGQRRHM
jgi:hypothetical protein